MNCKATAGKHILIHPQLAVESKYAYVYQHKDHLGNIRMSYSTDPQQPNKLVVLQENHTATLASFDLEILNFQNLNCPLGLQHPGYNMAKRELKFTEETQSGQDANEVYKVVNVPYGKYQYKFNGKEWQEELGLNFYDYGWRNYDAAIGRWMNVDPLAEQTGHVYSSMNNNPVNLVDPDGRAASPIYDSDGNFLGVDSQGFKGDVLVMDAGTYQNLSAGGLLTVNHEEAMLYGNHLDNSNLSMTSQAKIENHIANQYKGPIGRNPLIL
ncbi:MAG: RHS repeat-associated core domain-containing protein, partial [Weeksellaceae bacterium]|nr:RHS repeat-associated core domain-containing protein [Weeksellaceae bacterium]